MKEAVKFLVLVLTLLLIWLLLRQCEQIRHYPQPTPIPIPAKTVTPLPPTLTYTPTVPVTPTATPKPVYTPTNTPVVFRRGSGVLTGVVKHYRPATNMKEPLADVWVVLYFKGRKVKQAKTDAAGIYRFNDLPTAVVDVKFFGQTFAPLDGPQGLQLTDGGRVADVDLLIEEEFSPKEINVFFRSGVSEVGAQLLIKKHGMKFVSKNPESGAYVVELPKGKFAMDAIKEMKSERDVSDAMPDYYLHYR